jgi:uncharacterized membrane protein YphA (DoxX/SURF4 family)
MPRELQTGQNTRVERVGHSGIHPVSGPLPQSNAPVRGQGALAHPDERGEGLPIPAVPRESVALALGRTLFGGFFLYNGINHFLNRGMLTKYARSKNVPAAGVAVPLSGALIVLGGLSLLTGTRPRWGASLIMAFLLGVTPMHAFWKVEDEAQRMQELVNFTKNIALIGGAGFAAAVPQPWPGKPHAV